MTQTYSIEGRPVSEAEFREAIGAEDGESTADAISRYTGDRSKRKGRRGPLKNTADDDMALAQLMGVPGVTEATATAMMQAGISTKAEAAAYKAEQLANIERNRMAASSPRLSRRHPRRREAVGIGKGVFEADPTLSPAEIAREVVTRMMDSNPDDVPWDDTIAGWLRAKNIGKKRR